MHELGYCQSVVDAVERRAAGRPVARIGVRVGAMHRVVAEAFQQSFQLVAAGGVAADAVTEVVTVPMQASCPSCGARFSSVDSAPACPECGSPVVDTQGGDELVLEWIEYRPQGGDADVPRHPG
jgi:hydrogenase nickel incorporation protein HypA/HybF